MKEDFKANVLEFEKLKIEEKDVKRKLDVLKEAIMPNINPGDKILASKGSIELKTKMYYSYSEETQRMEEELKERQKEEVATGKATANPTTFLEYRLSKRSNEDEDA